MPLSDISIRREVARLQDYNVRGNNPSSMANSNIAEPVTSRTRRSRNAARQSAANNALSLSLHHATDENQSRSRSRSPLPVDDKEIEEDDEKQQRETSEIAYLRNKIKRIRNSSSIAQ
jgi:hypothetical protein